MATSKVTNPQPAMTEIKQSIVKRVSLKVSPKLKLSRSTSTPTVQITSSRYSLTATRRSSFLSSSANSIDSNPSIQEEVVLTAEQENKSPNKGNLMEENSQLNHSGTFTNNDNKGIIKLIQSEESMMTLGGDSQVAPVLMRKLTKAMSSSTTKTQKTNVVAAVAKTLPKNFIRSLRGSGDSSKKENDQPPINTLITTPSLSPPAVSQISYTSSTMVSERKKKNRRSRSGSFSSTAQALSNMLKRRSKNRSGSNDSTKDANGAPILTYESFPDPDPDDFFNVYSWDIPDSIVSIEDAGGVLQMIEYDGIIINGIKID
ncbi:hypothetical protein C1645_816821 [Glomus cerebriforme]|uniref:Uncharacterized protein n=1 Tax=Glomus cerebriforme TaxID=658196 RepID=A0A397TG20_9GLOM|nr:hypothetical protein C1645_816821 [Glomus cerebriforme]